MPSPHSIPPAGLPQGRKIAPFPLRISSSGSRIPATSQKVSNSSETPSPSPSLHMNQSHSSDAGPCSTYQDSPPELNCSSLPERVTPDHEISQPVHTLYSDEKIAILDTSSSPEVRVPTIVEDHLDVTSTKYRASSVSTTLLSEFHISDRSPHLDLLHHRNISDASDISDNNENNDGTNLYYVRDEESPPEPFFTAVFQDALQMGLDIAKRVVFAIEKVIDATKSSDDLDRLYSDAKKLENFQNSDTRTVAVLGDSGEGKSSLINSLLHFPEIAKTGDIGSACTSVVTEYRQKTMGHTAPITIEVEYLSESEIEELIKELLWNYRQVFLPEVEEDKVDAKDYARYQRESEQAWSAMEAGFRHQRSFSRQLLSDIGDGGLEKATSQLIRWAHEIKWPNGSSSGIWKATAETADECCEKTSIFMQDGFWPFTKIIRVYLDAQVLKTGIILADLPGLQDTNLARVRATQRYLMKCDNVFIVAKISRVITDQSVKSSLYNILARHAPVEWEESGARSLNLAVVCTKSEDINQKTARREFCGPNKEISILVMEQLDRDIEDTRKSNDKKLRKQLKETQESLLIDARNRHVKEGLQRAYASKVPGGQLEVFCVSNTRYEKYCRKGNADKVRKSGIPELRRFCHRITAEAQLLEAKYFLESTISSLLNSVELWASTVTSQPQDMGHVQHESILAFMLEVTQQISEMIRRTKAEFEETFREVLSEYLDCVKEQRNHFWEAAAEKRGWEWTGKDWHWSQYNAWCINKGDHQTSKRGRLNWNAELIWKMRMELAYQWGLLEDEIPKLFSKLLQTIKASLLDFQSRLEVQGFTPIVVGGIQFRIQAIEYKVSIVQQEFSREIKLVQRHASEPNESSYIVSEMLPAYRAAAVESGTGKAARQRSVVQGRITNGTLFPHISAKIQANIDKIVEKSFSDLCDAVNIILGSIVSDIEMALMSQSRCLDESTSQERLEEERHRVVLMAEIQELKAKHESLLASISDV